MIKSWSWVELCIGFGVATQEVEVYNDARDAWTKVNPMNSEKDGLAAVTFDHYLLSMHHLNI